MSSDSKYSINLQPRFGPLAELRHGKSDCNFFQGFLTEKSLAFNGRVREMACSVNLPS